MSAWVAGACTVVGGGAVGRTTGGRCGSRAEAGDVAAGGGAPRRSVDDLARLHAGRVTPAGRRCEARFGIGKDGNGRRHRRGGVDVQRIVVRTLRAHRAQREPAAPSTDRRRRGWWVTDRRRETPASRNGHRRRNRQHRPGAVRAPSWAQTFPLLPLLSLVVDAGCPRQCSHRGRVPTSVTEGLGQHGRTMRIPRNRDPERLRFTVSSARTVRLPHIPDAPPLLPWPLAALGGGLLAGLAGSLLVAGVVMIAWLSALAIALPTVLRFAAQVWLLAHGGELEVGSEAVTLVPLGLTIVFGAICASVGGFAYRQGRQARTAAQARRAASAPAGFGRTGERRLHRVRRHPRLDRLRRSSDLAAGPRCTGGERCRISDRGRDGRRPAPCPPASRLARDVVLRGAAAGTLGLVAAAAIVLATGTVLGEPRIAALEAGLRFDTGGVVRLVAGGARLPAQPARLGGSMAARSRVHRRHRVTGVAVHHRAGHAARRSRCSGPCRRSVPPTRGCSPGWHSVSLPQCSPASWPCVPGAPDHSGRSLPAGQRDCLTGIAYLAWAASSRGGLGSLRMAALGPRLLEALILGVPILLFSSVLAAMVTWFVRRRGPAA